MWRGGVNTWECDEMGHMNVRFYVAKSMEGLVGIAAALGLDGAFRPNAQSTLMLKEQHIRFLREARPRTALHMTAGVIAIGAAEALILQLLIHSASGEVAAAFQSRVIHVTTAGERAFAWSDRTRAKAAALMVEIPAHLAPRSLPMTPCEVTAASLARADSLGLVRLGAGAVGTQDCDAFGRMRPELFIGRVSDGVPSLAAEFRGETTDEASARPDNVGGAVLEYRLIHWAWPRAGDRFEIRSGLVGVDERAQRIAHWMLDPVTGEPWGTSEAIAVALDLGARKIIRNSQGAQSAMARRVTPGLAL